MRIAVVEDQFLTRKVLVEVVNDWEHGSVVIQAVHGQDLEAQLAQTGFVDLAIVDLLMPVRDGFETIEWIREHHPGTRMLAITFDPTDEYVHRALHAGAHGVLGKACMPQELYVALDALRTVGRHANDLVMRQLTYKPDPNSPWLLKKKLEETLSERELEVGRLYVQEDCPSRTAIAERLGISPHTVESHRRNVMEKTGTRTRLGLYKCFLRFGLEKL